MSEQPSWGSLGHAEKAAAIKDLVLDRGLSFARAAVKLNCTKNHIAGFVHRNRSELLGIVLAVPAETIREGKRRAGDAWSESKLTERYEDRKRRRIVRLLDTKPSGRPKLFTPEMDASLRRLWAHGDQIKLIAAALTEEFGVNVSEKSVKNRRLALNLRPRRALVGDPEQNAKEVHVYLSGTELRAAKRRANERGMALSAYLRLLVQLDTQVRK